jgi:hypothetical protein
MDIQRAFTLASEAQNLANNQNFSEALYLYRESVQIMNHVLQLNNDVSLMNARDSIVERIQTIEQSLKVSIHYPFELFQKLRDSMDPSGAYLTSRLFIPASIWKQPIDIHHLEDKIHIFEVLRTQFNQFTSATTKKFPQFIQSLQQKVQMLEQQKFKSKLFTKSVKREDFGGYVQALRGFLDSAQQFHELALISEADCDEPEWFLPIHDFIHHTLIKFVLQDVQSMVMNHFEDRKKAFIGL